MAIQQRNQASNVDDQLRRRTEEALNRTYRAGTNYQTIFRDDLDFEIPMWKCAEGRHTIDVMPFIAGPDMPIDMATRKSQAPEGERAYVLIVGMHRNVGGNNNYACLAWYGQPCPLCKKRQELIANDEPLPNEVKTTVKAIYNIICLDSQAEYDKGIQIWDAPARSTEEEWRELMLGGSGGAIVFADLKMGKSIGFARKGKGQKDTRYTGHQFLDRQQPYGDEMYEEALSLDQLIYIPTPDEMWEAFMSGTGAEEHHSSGSGGRSSSVQVPRKFAAPQPEEQTATERPAPAGPRRFAPKTSVPEASEPSEVSDVSTGDCPHGHIFGKDVNNNLPDCNTCVKWEVCVQAEAQNSDQQRASAPPIKNPPGRSIIRRGIKR